LLLLVHASAVPEILPGKTAIIGGQIPLRRLCVGGRPDRKRQTNQKRGSGRNAGHAQNPVAVQKGGKPNTMLQAPQARQKQAATSHFVGKSGFF
jgi:hypothetical protein